jgi:hypothetical protein
MDDGFQPFQRLVVAKNSLPEHVPVHGAICHYTGEGRVDQLNSRATPLEHKMNRRIRIVYRDS